MSTITISTPSRRPFASLGEARLRNLTNIKNKQNALLSTKASQLKYHAPNDLDDLDTENVDPLTFSSSSKKAGSSKFNLTKSDKMNLFSFTPKISQYVEHPQAAGRKRKAEDTITPNTSDRSLKLQRVAPSSAPAPAGRSPKSKKNNGILSRRRMTSSPFARINPPTSLGSTQAGMPLSIDAALAGTIPNHKSKSTRSKGWHFDIHEDTPDDEMANLMEHSTCVLDISDDESGTSLKGDRDNKENIPPAEGPAALSYSSSQVVASRRDMMTDEPRNPLGDLNAHDFYAEGCDASSVYIVAGDDAPDCINEKHAAVSNGQDCYTPYRSRANAINEGREGWRDIVAQLAAETAAANAEVDLAYDQEASKEEAAEIQIWESESAKGDYDAASQELEADGAEHRSLLP